MTKSQQYLIGAIIALLGIVVFIFRGDMFVIENRPGLSSLLQNYIQPYGLTIAFLLFAYLLSKSFGLKGWVFILVFAVWELSYIFMFNYGFKWLSPETKYAKWFGHYRGVALENRSMIQFQGESAQYDKELFYTLKPGSSTFKSYEFNTEYNVNALGLRDDSESLENPEVLFLGDSFTMGWGVGQNESFPAVFENKTKYKTLNTGISSYGTARESRMMARTQTDSLKAIIIQYHETDLEENDFYIKNNRLGSRTSEEFDNQVVANNRVLKYYPFKYIKIAVLNFAKQKTAETANSTEAVLTGAFQTYPNYVNDFYKILGKIHEIKNVPVILTYTGSFYTEPLVIQSFEKYAKENNIQNVHFVNLAGILKDTDYFYFDDHLNASGHQKVGEALAIKIKEILK
jgi:lysophospholipase L1-like esterase